jgi:hypothetical protein
MDSGSVDLQFSVPVRRGCGTRKKGGAYIDVGVGEKGDIPLSELLIDPPIPVDGWDIMKRGVNLTEDANGVTHILDWVGYKYYPNPSDFYEETRLYGLSRRINSNLDFSRLSRKSRILLIHPRAYLENLSQLVSMLGDDQPKECITGKHASPVDAIMDDENKAMCVSYWYKNCVKAANGRRFFTDAVSYDAESPPEGFIPEYRPAIFASFPAASIVVVGDDKKSDEVYAKVAIARENDCFITRVSQ